MKYGKKVTEALKGDFVPFKARVKMTPGESVRVMRELQEMSQAQLAEKCGIPQSTISGIESGRVNLGVERAKALARALKVHPAVLVFPGWDVQRESAA
jgi:transcriptional regulator with XRE-family HTH domain